VASKTEVSAIDAAHLAAIRANVRRFLQKSGGDWGNRQSRLLDIAPQDHDGARPFFADSVQVETLDIDPQAGTTYCADLCQMNAVLPSDYFDVVVCTEVLEHVLNPFAAVAEIRRVLKPGGILLATSPFNFRIHGPLPDCWRFTEHGWRALLAGFDDLIIEPLDDPARFLMPIHYAVSARKPSA
jgi:SAM-dependent methyltransferase